METTNLFGGEVKACINPLQVTSYKYIKADGDDWVVGRVEASYGDGNSSEFYMYGGKFFWNSFQNDERNFYSGEHVKSTLRYLLKSERFVDVFTLMFGMHSNLTVSSVSLDSKIEDRMKLRRDMFLSTLTDNELLRQACKSYFELLNSSVSKFNVESAVESCICNFKSKLSFPDRGALNVFEVDLKVKSQDDIEIWGDMYSLNDFDSIKLYRTSNLFKLEFCFDGRTLSSDAFKFERESEDNSTINAWLCVCAMFSLINNALKLGINLQLEGLLYNRDVSDTDKLKQNEMVYDAMKSGGKLKSKYNYSVNLFDILSDLLMQ